MKKKVYGRKLGRERDTRRALFRSIIAALVEHGRIVITKAKAKAVQGDIDRLITLAKKKTIAANRRLFAKLGNDKKTVKKLVKIIAPSFSDRKSGYTRMVNLPRRRGDGAEMVKLEWVNPPSHKATKGKANKGKKNEDISTKT